MSIGEEYLRSVKENFQTMKSTAERTMEQLTRDECQWAPDAESNSVDIIVKHLVGNLISRWSDFLTTDGEKPNRNRDAEFEGGYASTEELRDAWESGWETLFDVLGRLAEDDLLKTVYIRAEPHTVLRAIERQVSHYSHHVGQMVYLAKQIRNTGWTSLSIPRGKSQEYLNEKLRRLGGDPGR